MPASDFPTSTKTPSDDVALDAGPLVACVPCCGGGNQCDCYFCNPFTPPVYRINPSGFTDGGSFLCSLFNGQRDLVYDNSLPGCTWKHIDANIDIRIQKAAPTGGRQGFVLTFKHLATNCRAIYIRSATNWFCTDGIGNIMTGPKYTQGCACGAAPSSVTPSIITIGGIASCCCQGISVPATLYLEDLDYGLFSTWAPHPIPIVYDSLLNEWAATATFTWTGMCSETVTFKLVCLGWTNFDPFRYYLQVKHAAWPSYTSAPFFPDTCDPYYKDLINMVNQNCNSGGTVFRWRLSA